MSPWRMLLVTGALVSLLAVPMASAGKGGTDRPFKVTHTGALTFVVPEGCPPACQEFNTVVDLTGKATHLGRVHILFSHYPYNPARLGRMTITAANGDELWGEYQYPGLGEDSPISITGGTGRFTDAQGTVVQNSEFIPQFKPVPPCDPVTDPFECMNPAVPWPAWGTMTGTISY